MKASTYIVHLSLELVELGYDGTLSHLKMIRYIAEVTIKSDRIRLIRISGVAAVGLVAGKLYATN